MLIPGRAAAPGTGSGDMSADIAKAGQGDAGYFWVTSTVGAAAGLGLIRLKSIRAFCGRE